MDVAAFCTRSNVVVIAGKGGVGKTTVSATLAQTASRAGLDVMLLEIDGRSGAAALLGHPQTLDYREVEITPSKPGQGFIRARSLTPDDTLIDYLADHGLGKISRRLAATGALDVVATAVPGIKDILILGKVKQLEKAQVADLIILDAPASGHALTFLTSASGLVDAARVGPIRSQSIEVMEFLADAARCEVMLVTLAEETPVSETVQTAFKLEDQVGVSLVATVVNSLYSVIDGLDIGALENYKSKTNKPIWLSSDELRTIEEAADFRTRRIQLQQEQVARLASALPLPQLHLPYLFRPVSGPGDVERLADALAHGLENLTNSEMRLHGMSTS